MRECVMGVIALLCLAAVVAGQSSPTGPETTVEQCSTYWENIPQQCRAFIVRNCDPDSAGAGCSCAGGGKDCKKPPGRDDDDRNTHGRINDDEKESREHHDSKEDHHGPHDDNNSKENDKKHKGSSKEHRGDKDNSDEDNDSDDDDNRDSKENHNNSKEKPKHEKDSKETHKGSKEKGHGDSYEDSDEHGYGKKNNVCSKLEPTEHGRWTPKKCSKRSQKLGHKCKLHCDSGYSQLGGSEIRCTKSGWEGDYGVNSIPLCINSETWSSTTDKIGNEPTVMCDALPNMDNGVWQSSACSEGPSGVGTVCELMCAEGFELSANSRLSCSAHGWEGPAGDQRVPLCLSVNERSSNLLQILDFAMMNREHVIFVLEESRSVEEFDFNSQLLFVRTIFSIFQSHYNFSAEVITYSNTANVIISLREYQYSTFEDRVNEITYSIGGDSNIADTLDVVIREMTQSGATSNSLIVLFSGSESTTNGSSEALQISKNGNLIFPIVIGSDVNQLLYISGVDIRGDITFSQFSSWEYFHSIITYIRNSTGVTDGVTTQSTASCLALPQDMNGLWVPSRCSEEDSSIGDTCYKVCDQGFAVSGGIGITCSQNGWQILESGYPICISESSRSFDFTYTLNTSLSNIQNVIFLVDESRNVQEDQFDNVELPLIKTLYKTISSVGQFMTSVITYSDIANVEIPHGEYQTSSFEELVDSITYTQGGVTNIENALEVVRRETQSDAVTGRTIIILISGSASSTNGSSQASEIINNGDIIFSIVIGLDSNSLEHFSMVNERGERTFFQFTSWDDLLTLVSNEYRQNESGGGSTTQTTETETLSFGTSYEMSSVTYEIITSGESTTSPRAQPSSTNELTTPTEQSTSSIEATTLPSEAPSSTNEPTTSPSEEPSSTNEHTTLPSEEPSPTNEPTTLPSEEPSPTNEPTTLPSEEPSPTNEPTTLPSEEPSPTNEPTSLPSEELSPTNEASTLPSEEPSPTNEPTTSPSEEPTPTPCDALALSTGGRWESTSCTEQSSAVGTECQLVCDSGLELIGSSAVTCTENGWEGFQGDTQLPTCLSAEERNENFVELLNITLRSAENVVFLVEESSSVEETDFINVQLEFIRTVVYDFLRSRNISAGVITYSDEAHVAIPVGDYERSTFEGLVSTTKYLQGGESNISSALELAINELRGSRRGGSTVTFLISSSRSSTSGSYEATEMKNNGDLIFSLVIGEADINGLRYFSSEIENGQFTYYQFQSWESLSSTFTYMNQSYNRDTEDSTESGTIETRRAEELGDDIVDTFNNSLSGIQQVLFIVDSSQNVGEDTFYNTEIELVKSFTEIFLQGSKYYYGVTTYNDRATVDIPFTQYESSEFIEKVGDIQYYPRDGSDMANVLDRSFAEIRRSRPSRKTLVVVITGTESSSDGSGEAHLITSRGNIIIPIVVGEVNRDMAISIASVNQTGDSEYILFNSWQTLRSTVTYLDKRYGINGDTDVQVCEPLSNSQRGHWVEANCSAQPSNPGTLCELVCEEGYELSDDSLVFCNQSTWQGYSGGLTIPSCKTIQEIAEDFMSNINRTVGRPANLLFVVDGSGSLTSPRFYLEMDFVQAIVKSFPLSESRSAGVITFSTGATVAVPINDADTCNFLSATGNITYPRGGTDIALALNLALTEIQQHAVHDFTVVFLITDGVSATDPTPPANTLREQGNVLFAIGVGDYDPDQLKDIATYFYPVKDFDVVSALRDVLENEYINMNQIQC